MIDSTPLALREFHLKLGAQFISVNGAEAVASYRDVTTEHAAVCNATGLFDLSFRGRLCLTGADRVRFLHGQVTNDVKKLHGGEGCYATLTTAKGKMQSDLNIFALQDELLLDFEPGLTQLITQRLEKYIVADDVQVVDAAPHYGLLSVQGTKATEIIFSLGLFKELPSLPFRSVTVTNSSLGEIYLMNHPRLSGQLQPALIRNGFDLFVPNSTLEVMANKLISAVKAVGGHTCGWTAFEIARVEAGIPRFGADMDETNIPIECGIEASAVSYDKGCYIGQEVINRIHSIGHVNRELRQLRLADDLKSLPVKGDKLFSDGKEAGHITSAVKSPTLKANIALGYVRREAIAASSRLTLRSSDGETSVKIVGTTVG